MRTLSSEKRRRPAPLSIRLSDAEWAKLRALAGNQPVSTYVKATVFANGQAERRRRTPTGLPDQKLLGAVLAHLGQSSLATNMRILAHLASTGSLDCDERTAARLTVACAQISDVRDMLMLALDKEPRSEADRAAHIARLFGAVATPKKELSSSFAKATEG